MTSDAPPLLLWFRDSGDAVGESRSCDVEQFGPKDQYGIGRNSGWTAGVTVGEKARDGNFGGFPHRHFLDRHIQTQQNLLLAYRIFKWQSSISRAINLATVL
jgi:hypothetical protein